MVHEPLHILIVDDDEGDRRQVLRALKQTGIRCLPVEASDMNEALSACRTQTFDCAIVDYCMPGQDGLSGIANLQQQFPFLATIMATGQGDELVASEVIKRGATDYIPKDLVNARTLNRIIRNAIEKTTLQRKLHQQREELESFSRVLAHDLKAPSRHIQSLIGLMQKKMGEGDFDEETKKDMEYVCKAAKRMDALVDSLTAYTRFDADVEFANVSLEECIAVAASFLEGSIHVKGAQLDVQALPSIYGHEPQIIQLFQNLIGNALKYNESHPPVIQITAEEEEGMCRVVVQDNGIGIDERYCDMIFQPFKRLHGGESIYAGSGLGLATCRKIVERHGGTISCQSEKGRGSTFYLTLPVSASEILVV